MNTTAPPADAVCSALKHAFVCMSAAKEYGLARVHYTSDSVMSTSPV